MHTSPIKSQRERLQIHHKKFGEKAPKSPKRKMGEQHKALRNCAESSIHTMKVHTRSSLPPDHPSLSKDLTMKLSS
jgi:hypothetical protein